MLKTKLEAENLDKTFMTFLNHQNETKVSNVLLNTVSKDPSMDIPQLSLDSARTRNTSQELQKRYKRKQVIYVFSEGEKMTKEDCACYKFELNKLIKRY